jgi:hypothetical protein
MSMQMSELKGHWVVSFVHSIALTGSSLQEFEVEEAFWEHWRE